MDIHDEAALPPQALRGSQQAIIEAINNRRRAERSHEMIALARGSLATGSGNHHNPSSSTKHSSAWMSPSRLSSQQNNRSLGAVRQDGQPIAIPLSIDSVSSGLKIRIPRDLPNLPEAFRKRGAVRSQSSTTASTSTGSGTQPGIKRSHSTMVQEDHPESNDYVSYGNPKFDNVH
ncbi:hypothetical protein BX616_000429, partial [Lobosporangium transversale]